MENVQQLFKVLIRSTLWPFRLVKIKIKRQNRWISNRSLGKDILAISTSYKPRMTPDHSPDDDDGDPPPPPQEKSNPPRNSN